MPTTKNRARSLHDALPIYSRLSPRTSIAVIRRFYEPSLAGAGRAVPPRGPRATLGGGSEGRNNPPSSRVCGPCERSEEHTSELQSPDKLECRILLEYKNIQ